jgi:AGZA family xanthine/uracil permease-like MFS transporter
MLKKLFGFDAAKHSVKTEVLAGITTFLTMAYILAVNPSIMGVTGMDKGALFTSTALVSALACILMALYAKLPIALAPGMGLNAFFAFVVCLAMGYSWQMALTAVFLEGLIFIFLTITNLREKLLEALPLCVKNAIGPAIGLFIAFLGMQNAGLIVKNDATMVALGDMTAATPLLCLIGLCITAALMIKGMNGALLWGMLITTLLGIPMGVTNIGGIVSAPPSMESICFAL